MSEEQTAHAAEEVEFRRLLDDNNALRVRFELDRGLVLKFVVQLECRIADRMEWAPVIRYDTAHGFAHCDQLHPYDETVKIVMATIDYNEALNFAIEDLASNWTTYRGRYERWLTRR